MTLWFILGTAAELIKIYPLILEAQKRGLVWRVLSTGQSGKNFWNQYDDFKLPRENSLALFETKSDLKNSISAMLWFSRAYFTSSSRLKNKIHKKFGRLPQHNDFVFVHGDTFSTLVGTIYGNRLKVPVVHVEAGMRSGNLMSPFPEEINRKLVSKKAQYHMAPDEKAVSNLRSENIKGMITMTHGNTVMESLLSATNHISHLKSQEKFVIANFHRHENLSSQKRWNAILELCHRAAEKHLVYFIMQPNVKNKMEVDPQTQALKTNRNIVFVDRMPFLQFTKFLFDSEFVITDGGSHQQECFYLGKPCLIMRDVTESIEGVGANCVLSKFDNKIINDFLSSSQSYARAAFKPQISPTQKIFESLKL